MSTNSDKQMNTIIQFPAKIYFAPDILKYEDEDGETKQEIVICLKKKDSRHTVISPVTSLMRPFSAKAYSTQYEYSRCLCGLLNYLYDTKKVTRFEQITTQMVADYISYCGVNNCARKYVLSTLRVLKYIFYYASKNYPSVCGISADEFDIAAVKHKTAVRWPELEASVLIPSAKTDADHKMNKLTNLNVSVVFRMIEIAYHNYPDCALGMYFMFFGGLRADEALHLTSDDIPTEYGTNSFFVITVEDKILNPDLKYSDLKQNKKQRRQTVFYVPELYDMLYSDWQKRYSSGPIIRNRFGSAMTVNGFSKNFASIKNILIKKLQDGSMAEKRLAFQLSSFHWSTHIGRGFFSNLVAENYQNPYMVPTARGDSSFSSALPYIADNERRSSQISAQLSEMYKSLHEGKNKLQFEGDADEDVETYEFIANTTERSNEQTEPEQSVSIEKRDVSTTAFQHDVTDLVINPEDVKEINPDTYKLGISFGSLADYRSAALMANVFNTHTVMVYCDNKDFDIPDAIFGNKYNLVIHGPLNMNLASNNAKQAMSRMIKIIDRCNKFSTYIDAMVLHPGSADDMQNLIQNMKVLLGVAQFPIAVENMAGCGNQLLTNYDDILYFKESLEDFDNLKLCFDTCHLNDAGIKLNDYDSFLDEFLQYFSPEDIAVFHINDSRNKCGSHKDRHANIGTGTIPVEFLHRLVTDNRFITIPKILETPQPSNERPFNEEMKLLLS